MATNIFSLIGLYLSMIYYLGTGAVDPSIFSDWITDTLQNISMMISTMFV